MCRTSSDARQKGGRDPFVSIEDAQAAVDAWRTDYNTGRPHQSLAMAYPAARFAPAAGDALGLRGTRRAGRALVASRP
jgi:transposase InsO family protein